MKNYTDELDNLRIHELRDLARKMGVQSPTTLKKEQIIQNIMEILSGKKEPYVSSSKQGRPPRNQEKAMSIVDIFNEDEWEARPYDLNPDDHISYSVCQPSVKYTVGDESSFTDIEGYLDVKKNYGLVRLNGYLQSDKDVVVPIQIVNAKNLKSGMFIKGKANQAEEHSMIMDLNFTNLSKFDFDELEGKNLNNKINFNYNEECYFGGRYTFDYNNIKNLYDSVYSVAEDINKNNDCKVKIIYIDALQELIKESSQNIETLILPFNKTAEECFNAVNLFIEKCKREVEEENNIVVIVCGFIKLIKYGNLLYSNNSLNADINYNALIKVKNIMNSTKQINEKSSLSLLAFNGPDVPNAIKECFEYELKPLFHNQF